MLCQVISKEQLNYSVLVNEASAEQQLKLLVIKRVRNPAHALQHAAFTALCYGHYNTQPSECCVNESLSHSSHYHNHLLLNMKNLLGPVSQTASDSTQ